MTGFEKYAPPGKGGTALSGEAADAAAGLGAAPAPAAKDGGAGARDQAAIDRVDAALRDRKTVDVHRDDKAAGLGLSRPDGKSPDEVCAWQPWNDVGNAARLIVRHGNDIMHVPEVGWYVWDGDRWNRDDGKRLAALLTQRTFAAMRDEARVLERAGTDPEIVKAFRAHIRKSGNAGALANMLTCAAPQRTVDTSALDAAPLLLPVGNGTLELGVRPVLREPRREDRLTRRTPVPYDPDADCPIFKEFLGTILPDPEVRDFLLRYFGYALTGNISEQCLVFLYGSGSNGKSTLLNVIGRVLGEFALTIPIESLLADDRRSGAAATPDLAQLPGVRLAMAAEPEQGARLSESRIKALTGGDEIPARHLHQGIFRFRPQFKLVVACNHRPRVLGTDDGIWRRIRLVPFTVKVTPEDVAPVYQAMDAELPGILNLLVTYCADWRARGLAVPAAVRDSTADFQADSDPVGNFVEECTDLDEEARMPAGRLYAAYAKYCRESAMEPRTMKTFARRLKERGIKWIRADGTKYFLRLKPEAVHWLEPADGSGAKDRSGQVDRSAP